MGLDPRRFLSEVESLTVRIDGRECGMAKELVANAKQFRTGSLGWYGSSGRMGSVSVLGEEVQVIVNVNVTILGTKGNGGEGGNRVNLEEEGGRNRFAKDIAPVYVDDEDSVRAAVAAGDFELTEDETKVEVSGRRGNFSHVEDLFRSKLKIKDVVLEQHFSNVFFFPDITGKNITQLLNYLCSAKKSLEVCVFALTDNRFRDTVTDLHSKAVSVRVVTDLDMAKLRGSEVLTLHEAGVPVRLGGEKAFSNMHHKFAVVDRKLLLTGSFNWTVQASRNNQENVLVTVDPTLVHKFSQQFEQMWQDYNKNEHIPNKDLIHQNSATPQTRGAVPTTPIRAKEPPKRPAPGATTTLEGKGKNERSAGKSEGGSKNSTNPSQGGTSRPLPSIVPTPSATTSLSVAKVKSAVARTVRKK